MRTIITSDIHGCFKQLCELLDLVKFNENEDKLIVLGDLADRGPDSYHVFFKLRNLQDKMGDRCIIIMGNHEDMMIQAIEKDDRFSWETWEYNGSSKTMRSFEENHTDIEEFYDWAKNFPCYYNTDEFLCVHAGLGNTLEDKTSLIWSRSIAFNHNYNSKLLFYGHTPTKNVIFSKDEKYKDGSIKYHIIRPGKEIILPKTGAIGIDTGCVFNNKLTAVVIENGVYQIYQVDNPKEIKPRKKKEEAAID